MKIQIEFSEEEIRNPTQETVKRFAEFLHSLIDEKEGSYDLTISPIEKEIKGEILWHKKYLK